MLRNLALVLIIACASCSLVPEKNKYTYNESCPREDNECSIQKYEYLLKQMQVADHELLSKNPFAAYLRLEKLKDQGAYHGTYKNLYFTAQKAALEATNKLARNKKYCSLVKDRVDFFKIHSSDNLVNLSYAIETCVLRVDSNYVIDVKTKLPIITEYELSQNDLFAETIRTYNKSSTLPLAELLLIDLQILASYDIKIKDVIVSKNQKSQSQIEVILPVEIIYNGEGASDYCSQYAKILHNEDYESELDCWDYPGFFASIFHNGSTTKWSQGFSQTKIKVSPLQLKDLKEIPISKNFQEFIKINLSYSSKPDESIITEIVSTELSIPKGLLGRLAFTREWMLDKELLVGKHPLLRSKTESENYLALHYSRQRGFYFILQLPVEKLRDLTKVSIHPDLDRIRQTISSNLNQSENVQD